MTLKQEIISLGFQIICKNQDGIEVLAKFTGTDECVQYLMMKDDKKIGDLSTITLSSLLLHHQIFEALMYGKGAGKREIYPVNEWDDEWKKDMFRV